MNSLSDREAAIIAAVRANDVAPRLEIRRELRIGNLSAVFSWRSRKSLWGRFGGGCNWKLGAQAGCSTLIVDCLVFSLRFSLVKP